MLFFVFQLASITNRKESSTACYKDNRAGLHPFASHQMETTCTVEEERLKSWYANNNWNVKWYLSHNALFFRIPRSSAGTCDIRAEFCLFFSVTSQRIFEWRLILTGVLKKALFSLFCWRLVSWKGRLFLALVTMWSLATTTVSFMCGTLLHRLETAKTPTQSLTLTSSSKLTTTASMESGSFLVLPIPWCTRSTNILVKKQQLTFISKIL